MAELTEIKKNTRSFWVISIVALVWNLIGIMNYLMSVTMSPETLASLPETERALYNAPAWVTSAFAIAVFGGTIASIALLMKKAWSVPLFIVSLVAIIFQMSYGFFATPMLEDQGAAAAILPMLILAVAIYLVWFSLSMKKKGVIS